MLLASSFSTSTLILTYLFFLTSSFIHSEICSFVAFHVAGNHTSSFMGFYYFCDWYIFKVKKK
ncbi:MAG: hypothetical protein KAU83_00870, partial [Bacteroidales bacterium]|nr:hypothetical protein [Bacteroidales bacterium]